VRAIRVDQTGPAENLKLVETPAPECGDDAVLIDVALAGIIYADVEQRRGSYYIETKLPHYPGREVAGTIVKIGANVTGFTVGQRVTALVLSGGGYAEQVVAPTRGYTFPSGITVPAADIVALPGRVSFGQGLVYIINFRIAYMLFHAYLNVAPRAFVMIHGAAGGFGSVLTQIAAQSGARVIAICRTAAESHYCEQNGAESCVNTAEVDYVEAVLALTGGEGANYSLNGVAGTTLAKDPHALKTFGELVVYGYAAGKLPVDIFAFTKSITIKTFSADDFLRGAAFSEATAAMHEWFDTKHLLDVTRVFSLDDAAGAHRWIEAGSSLGKVALAP
jgi:NADPH2:quinone reductase